METTETVSDSVFQKVLDRIMEKWDFTPTPEEDRSKPKTKKRGPFTVEHSNDHEVLIFYQGYLIHKRWRPSHPDRDSGYSQTFGKHGTMSF
jgi:hypothetical protein